MRSFGMVDKLLEFELALGEFYGWLGAVFEDNREALATFNRLKVDEQGHAELVREHRELMSRDRTQTIPLAANVDDVNRLLEFIKAFRTQSHSPELCRAIDVARSIEMTAAMRLHRSTAVDRTPGRTPFVERLSSDGMKHVEVLEALRSRTLGLDG